MNIGLVKIGQKIIFDRDSKDVKRSNTNGNQGLYKLIMLLVENRKDDTFFVISNSDLQKTKDGCMDNVYTYCPIDDLDCVFVFTGLGEYEKDIHMLKRLNRLYKQGVKFIFICEDPRCLESMNYDVRMIFKPSLIIGQTNSVFGYKGSICNIVYVPIEKATCYKESVNEVYEKNTPIIAVANTSGEKYNRSKILKSLIGGNSIPVYGRLSGEERLYFDNYNGEVEYSKMMQIMRDAYSTIIIPIRKGWVTSKYVEALLNGVFPIFYKDYNTSLLHSDFVVVDDSKSLKNAIDKVLSYSDVERYDIINNYIDVEIKPFLSGKLLCDMIMEKVII